MKVCTQKPSIVANGCYTLYLAKRDQSAAMLSPNYFSVFCVIKYTQKMAYIMNAMCLKGYLSFLHALINWSLTGYLLYMSWSHLYIWGDNTQAQRIAQWWAYSVWTFLRIVVLYMIRAWYQKSLTAQTGSTDACGSWSPPQSHSLTGDRRMRSPAQGHASCRRSEATGIDLGGT